MKSSKLLTSIPARVAAFLLAAAMTCAILASAVAAAVMVNENIYAGDLDSVRRNFYTSELSTTCMTELRYVRDGDENGAQYLSDGTNVTYAVRDPASRVLWTNRAANVNEYDFTFYFQYDPERGSLSSLPYDDGGANVYTVTAYVNADFPVQDRLALMDTAVSVLYALRWWVYAIGGSALVLLVFCFVFLMCAAGHRRGSETITAGWAVRIPFDLLAAAYVLAAVLAASAVAQEGEFGSGFACAGLAAAGTAVFSALGTALCMNLAVRVKLGAWWRNTVVCRLLRLCGKILKAVWGGLKRLFLGFPLIWKTAVCFAALCILEIIVVSVAWGDAGAFAFWWLAEKLLLAAGIGCLALALRELQKGGRALAAGDMSYQVDTKRMRWDLREHGENLNSIGVGMSKAVDERLKSERLKTELITNVSHDIKTPLTSIINYSDLICREKSDNEKINEYAAVLLRQSERLKKLIEDLIEASKASTGNVEVALAPCEAGVLLSQTAGEYEKRLADRGLTLVTRQPDEPLRIMADGRLLWRVFDNLMNNICKYSQSGTRVYLTLEEEGGDAVISFKNTSKYPLDVSADELMERFVRGDSSRSTEGSGLGLSIAKSLTELQGGRFALAIDGDLFKAVLRFQKLGA